MKKIHTVSGEIDPKALGFTQCHEHIMLSKGQSYLCNEALWFDDLELSSREVEEYHMKGGSGLVDAQPAGCNRMEKALAEIAEKTEIHILASTGFHKMQFYPGAHWIRGIEWKKLADLFIHELTVGMYAGMETLAPGGSGIQQMDSRAGIIKTALDKCGLDMQYRSLFLAAAAAQKETGAPLMVHIENGSRPLELADFFASQGLEADKIYFCHMDRNCQEKEVIKAVLDRGINLEFDTIGRPKYHSDAEEIRLMKFVLDLGYEDKLLFSLDTTRARLKAYDPRAIGLSYIREKFLTDMRYAGITEKQIEKISIQNPRRILAW